MLVGIETVFIIGGDADQRGPFTDAPGLLRSFLDKNPKIKTVGIGSYPDGHPSIPESLRLLKVKFLVTIRL